jgi:hypothetical protein
MTTFLYLGSPYSHSDPAVRQDRYEKVLKALAQIAGHKIPVYCPIAAWHPVSVSHCLPGDYLFWWKQDAAFLRSCSMAWFLVLPGLDDSSGIKAEKEELQLLKKPYWNVDPEDLDRSCTFLLSRGAFVD